MANGFAKTKELDKEGCEQGRMREYKLSKVCIDVNSIGKKLDRIQWFMVVTTVSVAVDVIVRVSK